MRRRRAAGRPETRTTLRRGAPDDSSALSAMDADAVTSRLLGLVEGDVGSPHEVRSFGVEGGGHTQRRRGDQGLAGTDVERPLSDGGAHPLSNVSRLGEGGAAK